MKRDDRTGEYFIIEPLVGRPGGTTSIAEAGGVELLSTMYCDATGQPLPERRTQRYQGAKWIDFQADVKSAMYYRRQHELTIRQWWRSLRGCKVDAMFDAREPMPAIMWLR